MVEAIGVCASANLIKLPVWDVMLSTDCSKSSTFEVVTPSIVLTVETDKTSGTPVAAVFLPINDAVEISFIFARVTALAAMVTVPAATIVASPDMSTAVAVPPVLPISNLPLASDVDCLPLNVFQSAALKVPCVVVPAVAMVIFCPVILSPVPVVTVAAAWAAPVASWVKFAVASVKSAVDAVAALQTKYWSVAMQ